MVENSTDGQLNLFDPDQWIDEPVPKKSTGQPEERAATDEGPQASPHRHFIAFDVETKKSFEEVGGRNHMEKLEISVAVTYNSKTDEYTTYREHQLEDMVEELKTAEVVVGFNIIGFDYPVLQPYTQFDLYQLPTMDMMLGLEHELGYRIGLDKVASATLGLGKSGHGLQAIDWYREGQWDLLIKYCRQDVKVTKDIFEFARDNGFLYIPAAGSRRKVEVRIQ